MATRQRFLSHRSLAFGTGRVRGILPKVSRRRHSPQPASSLISATSSFMLDRPLHITKATACVIVSAEEDVRAVKDLTSCASTRAERGPKEIAQEIQPSKEARDSTQGTPRLELDLWVKAHEALVKEVEAAKEKGLDLVFYGDSITESWRGTQLRVAADKFAGIPAIFAKHYGQLKAAAYGIAGDTTVNLLWRLQNGEGPEGLKAKAIVVLIGTNDLVHQMDLTAADAVAANVSTGAVAVVDALRQQAPRAQVLLLAVLPRGDRFVEAPSLRFLQPSKFTASIDAINERMKAYAVLHKQVDFVECGEAFREASEQAKESTGLDKALIPDTLHPSPEGMEKLAQCLQPHLRRAGISPAAAHRHLLAAAGT